MGDVAPGHPNVRAHVVACGCGSGRGSGKEEEEEEAYPQAQADPTCPHTPVRGREGGVVNGKEPHTHTLTHSLTHTHAHNRRPYNLDSQGSPVGYHPARRVSVFPSPTLPRVCFALPRPLLLCSALFCSTLLYSARLVSAPSYPRVCFPLPSFRPSPLLLAWPPALIRGPSLKHRKTPRQTLGGTSSLIPGVIWSGLIWFDPS